MANNKADVSGNKNPNFKHGWKYKKQYAGLYNSWQNMMQRCTNENHPKYNRYGGRGVFVYEPWKNSHAFCTWAVNNGWISGLSLDRKDNDGPYTPENCQWITKSANSRKKRTTKITFEQAQLIRNRINSGECEYKLADEFGVRHGTVWFIKNNITHVEEGICSMKIKERNKNKC